MDTYLHTCYLLVHNLTFHLILVKGAWEDGEADYSEETKRCFQNWVNGQIDDTLLKQATTAVYETGVASGNLQSALNGETGLPPNDVLMLAKTYYERIMSNRGKCIIKSKTNRPLVNKHYENEVTLRQQN